MQEVKYPVKDVEFYFEGMAIGLFVGDAPPVETGSYEYKPFRGPGHVDMVQMLNSSGITKCYYDTGIGRLFFHVMAMGEGNILALANFELVQLGQKNWVDWLEPWVPAVAGLEKELEKEIGKDHVLFGHPCSSVARRIDKDDVLFQISGQEKLFAVVQLTWSGKTESDSQFPKTELFHDIAEWVEKKMKRDHQEYMGT